MDAVKDLLEEVQRMQCLIYLARRQDETTPVRDLMKELRLSPGPCRAFMGVLTREGLVGIIPTSIHPLPQAVWLTEQGRAKVQEWEADARADTVHAQGA